MTRPTCEDLLEACKFAKLTEFAGKRCLSNNCKKPSKEYYYFNERIKTKHLYNCCDSCYITDREKYCIELTVKESFFVRLYLC
jgi:hypothetical protein